jgi:hypothetical protein
VKPGHLVAVFSVMTLWVAAAHGQRFDAPLVDEAGQDPALLAVRETLLQAIAARDVDTVLAHTCPDIQISFGGDGGHDALRWYLEVPFEPRHAEQRERISQRLNEAWLSLENVLRLGGRMTGDGQFWAPYSWNVELPERFDPLESFFVVGSGIPLRESGDANSKLLLRLDYEVVTLRGYTAESGYLPVTLGNGARGYIHSDYLRSAVDYRANFVRDDEGNWKMCTFIAGD